MDYNKLKVIYIIKNYLQTALIELTSQKNLFCYYLSLIFKY